MPEPRNGRRGHWAPGSRRAAAGTVEDFAWKGVSSYVLTGPQINPAD